MRVNVAIPEAHVKAPVLDAALESVTRLNEAMLAEGAPTFDRALIRGIKWRPEPPGQEHFDHLKTVNARGWGDCDDLAPYHAASLRHTGEDEGAHAIVKRSGPKTWHAVVRRSDGSIDDPSARAGMGPGVKAGVRGAVLPLMYPAPSSQVVGSYIIRPQIAMRPVRGAAQARVDIPWQYFEHLHQDKPTPTDYAMTSLHTAPVASAAITGADPMQLAFANALQGAIVGGIRLANAAGFADPEHLDGLEAIAALLDGLKHGDLSAEELEEEFGGELAHRAQVLVGSFFSHLNPLKGLRSLSNLALHNPLTSMAANFVPGGRAALDAANSIYSHLPGTHPAGPMFPGMQAAPQGAPGVHRATIVFD